jgi:hypothetical protein
MKKRILELLSVVALMVVMLAMSVAPAFAAKAWQCVDPTGMESVMVSTKFEKERFEVRGWECTKLKKKKPQPL